MRNLEELFPKIFIKPKKLELYELALTHTSYNADAKTKHQDYERLEYIGDAVLGFVAADLIFKLHPHEKHFYRYIPNDRIAWHPSTNK